jgi:hypothetical protein
MKKATLIVFYLAATGLICAQEPKATTSAPKTQIEAFASETGAVLIKGFSTIGSVSGSLGSISIDAREFTNAKNGKKSYGIVIDITQTGNYEKDESSYIDYDEIDDLVAGLDYISKVDGSVTKLKNFEATYTTRSGFAITVFNQDVRRSVAVSSGGFSHVTAFLPLEKLVQFRNLITHAKGVLDGLQN